jgi:hypothetical protein
VDDAAQRRVAEMGERGARGERRADGFMRRVGESRRQRRRQRVGQPARIQRRVNAADQGDPERATEQARGSLTAEPTPALFLGTTPMIASVAGALVKPMPVPKMTICAAIVP